MSDPLTDANVVLGVTGSIAAYKALQVASLLVQAGAGVDAILTRSASELVTPLAFQALTHRPVLQDLWRPVGPSAIDHVSLARSAQIMIVAPATADTLARLALGRADDALTTTALATRAPLLLAPAMEPNMWSHPATQAHAATLRDRGAVLVGPTRGRMASGVQGVGRLAEPEEIVDRARCVLARRGPWSDRRVLVTAGPTREPIDPVRYLSNRSSGTMGYALAVAARNRGATVILVSGPVALPPPVGVQVIDVETAQQMADRVLQLTADVDALLMTAAVADYRPAAFSDRKVKKAPGDARLELTRTVDILQEVDARLGDDRRLVRVGFAAETHGLLDEARRKLAVKRLDLIVANPVPASFGAGEAQVVILDHVGETNVGPAPKPEIAEAILDRVAAAWNDDRYGDTRPPEARA